MKTINKYYRSMVNAVGVYKLLIYIVFILIIYSIYFLQPLLIGQMFNNKNFSILIISLFVISYFHKSILKLPSNLMLQNIRFNSQKILWNDISNCKDNSIGEIQNLITVSSLSTRNIQSIFLHNILPSFLGIIIYTFITFKTSIIIGISYFASYILFFIVVFFTGKNVNKEIENCLNASTDIKNYIIDYFYNYDYIRANESYEKESSIYTNLLYRERKAYFKQQFNVDSYFIFQDIMLFIITIFQIIILYFNTDKFNIDSFLIILYSLNSVKDIGTAFLMIKEYDLKLKKSLQKLNFGSLNRNYKLPTYNIAQNDILKVSNLTVLLDDKYIIKDFSFNMHNSDKVALIGKNGSGKTTLLKKLVGISIFDQGKIEYSVDKSDINYIPQHARLFNRTIIENIVYPRNIESILDTDIEYIMKFIDILGLNSLIKSKDDLFQKSPKDFGEKFSGGE